MRVKQVLGGFLLFVAGMALVVTPALGDAQTKSTVWGQYVVGKATYNGTYAAVNPGVATVYTLLILHEEQTDGALQSGSCDNGPCAVCVVPAKGTDDDCFEDKCSYEERSMYRAVTVEMDGS